MKIDTNSWHFKYRDNMEFRQPDNLCQYVRQMVAITLLVPLMLVVVLCIIYAATSVLWQFIFDADLVVVITGGIVNIIALIALWKAHRDTFPHKEPGIVLSYIRAKHRKICPLLDYE